MNPLREKFGARVRELRKNLGYSQEKLADKIDWETPNLSNLENGKCFLKPESIEKIATALNVEVKELFDFEHFQDREFLLNYIESFLNNASLSDITFLYPSRHSPILPANPVCSVSTRLNCCPSIG